MLEAIREARPGRLTDGGGPARERSEALDEALRDLMGSALGPSPSVALAAVGGYGRGELSPFSDIDLLVLAPAGSETTPATVRGLLYPLWDAGFEVGHAVRTPKETVERASADLDTATSILSARWIAGDRDLFDELIDRRTRWLMRDAKKLARRIVDSTRRRHGRVERAGWVLAPDLKEDVGGLRDVHRLRWLWALSDSSATPAPLAHAESVLLAAREALHAETGRRQDRIRIDLQTAVARRLGLNEEDGASRLMHEIHSSARTIEHAGALFEQELLAPLLGGPKRSGFARILSSSTRVDDGVLRVARAADTSVAAATELIAERAHIDAAVEVQTIAWLTSIFETASPDPWDGRTREAFFRLLRGPHVVDALELLEHTGGWPALMPEWSRVRALAQHDPYHRYTVDGHLFVATGEVARVLEQDAVARIAAREAGDLDDLRLAALLHDVGKGSGRDHSEEGEELARAICTRIGLSAERIQRVAALVRHHLTLVDTATRRNLDDGEVISSVAEAVGDPIRLRLLYILSIADGRATGPDGWSEWKGALLRELYKKTLAALETGALPVRSDVKAKAEEVEAYEPSLAGRALDVLETLPRSYLSSTHLPDIVDDVKLLLQAPARGELRYRVDDGTEPGEAALTICVADRPGALARTAGVLAMHRLSVLRAQAFSTTAGLALERFMVGRTGQERWQAIAADLEAVFSGRLALEARLDRKIRDYGAAPASDPDVRVLQDASQHSTVIEVRAFDAIGLLYGITAALGELDLDIHVAKIDTLGERVVDVFYVRTGWGTKLNEEQTDEVKRAIRHRLQRLYNR
ncbi:MAG: [protein-PII] uridylyltransferase [Actinomycetota bacterium]